MNIKFSYLYRDAANYKNYGEVIFSNPENISTQEATNTIENYRDMFIFFSTSDLEIPDLHFESHNDDDVEFHEFESFEATNDAPTDKLDRSISKFLSLYKIKL